MGNWLNKKVKELCHIGRGRVISQEEIQNNPGVYPVYSSQSINKGEMGRIDSYDFEGEYVTWTTDGAYAGTVFHREGKFNCTNVCGILKAKEDDKLDLLFLSYLLSTQAKKYVSYVGNPKLMNGVMAEIDLTLPESKSEQTRIAQILSTADRVISQTEALIAKYQRIKTGLMQDLLTRGIDEHGRIRSKATHRFVVKNGIEVPEEWSVPCFGDIIELVHGYQFRNYDFTIHGLPVVKISQVKPEGLDLSSCSFIAENRIVDFEKQRIKNGDVLMALTGATLGKACLVQSLVGDALQNYRVGRFEPLEENDVDKTYLYYVLTTKEFLNQIFNKVNAGAQGNIGKSDFEKAFIAKPPYNEQVKIAKILLKITSVLEKEIQKRKKLQSLKTGLMQDLLSGRVRVKLPETEHEKEQQNA